MPPIWRRFLVPGAITLHGLHRVIQEVMGWENYHLHLFRFGKKEYGIPDPDYPTEMRNERGRRLREFLRDEGEVFGYEYDFGDSWEHDLVVEPIVIGAEVPDATYLEGERVCTFRCRMTNFENVLQGLGSGDRLGFSAIPGTARK